MNTCGRFPKMDIDKADDVFEFYYITLLQASEQVDKEIKSAKTQRASRTG
jgi:hypothetical protein